MTTILFVILFLILLGVIPAWPHSRSWGWTQRRNRVYSDHPTSSDVIGYILTAREA